MLRPRFPPFLRLLFFALGSFALLVLVTLVIGAALQFSRRATPEMPPLDFSQPGVALFFTALSYPPLLLWIWFCRHVFDRRNYVSLGLGITRATRNFLAGGALGALAIALVFGVLLLCGGARINGFAPEAINAGTGSIAGMLLFYGALYFAVGYFEETVFRGYFLQNFSAWFGKSGAVAAQAALFAAIHLMNPNQGAPANRFFAMLNIALVGWLLALCYLKSGSLWYSIGLHAAWNFFLGCVFSLPVSGNASFRLLDVSLSQNALLTGGAFGPEGGVLPVLIFLTLIWQARRLPDHARAVSELDALQHGETLLPTPVAIGSGATQNEDAPLSQAEETAREYSPPRYKTTLGAPPRRAAEIDWSDVNTRGGAPATAAFTPGAATEAPLAASGAISLSASESAGAMAIGESATSFSAAPASGNEAPREYSQDAAAVEFTPQIAPSRNAEKRGAPSIANPKTGLASDASASDISASNVSATGVSTSSVSATNLSASGEAPLPAGARVTASRSNFGGATPSDAAPRDARVLAPGEETSGAATSNVSANADANAIATSASAAIANAGTTSEHETPRRIEAPSRFLSAPPPLPPALRAENAISQSEAQAAKTASIAPAGVAREGEVSAPGSVPAAPPLPTSLPAPPPMRAVSATASSSESETPRSRIPAPPALIGAPETPTSAPSESASTREPTPFAPTFVAGDSENAAENRAAKNTDSSDSEEAVSSSKSGASTRATASRESEFNAPQTASQESQNAPRATSSAAAETEKAKPKARW